MKQAIIVGIIIAIIAIAAVAVYLQGWMYPATTTVTPSAPSLAIVSPADGAMLTGGSVTVTASSINFNIPAQGHYHLFLDGANETRGPGPSFTFINLSPGTHVIRAELHNPDHSPLSPPVVQQITITVIAAPNATQPNTTAQPNATAPVVPAQNTTNITTQKTASVTIQGYAFNLADLRVSTGTTVTWTNMDYAGHTVTSDSGSEMGSPVLSQGQSYAHTFSTAGTFSYHCSIHPYMKGTVTVTS